MKAVSAKVAHAETSMMGQPTPANTDFRARWCMAIGIGCVLALARPVKAQSERAPVRDPEHTFYTHVWSYKEIQQRRIVMQKYDYSCGAAALATIAKYYWGDKIDEPFFLAMLPKLKLSQAELRDRMQNGLTLTDLRDMAHLGGYDASMGKVQFKELAASRVPVIVGITVNGHDHFVVFRGSDGLFAYVADPLRGNIRTTIPEFLKQWQRNAILVVAKPNTPVKAVNPLGLRASEIERGVLNDQWVHRNYLAAPIPGILTIP